MSGAGFRVVCHIIMLVVGSAMIMRYALKVKKDPTKSVVYGTFLDKDHSADDNVEQKEFGVRQVLVLIDLLVMIIVLIWGVKTKGWYFAEISTLFLIMGIIAAIIMGYGPQKIRKDYRGGIRKCSGTCIDGRPCPWHSDGDAVRDDHRHGRIWTVDSDGTFPGLADRRSDADYADHPELFHSIRFRTGGDIYADYGTLADLLGVSRDTACLAFQFGDGLSNIIWPTAYAAVMSGLAESN